MNAKRLYIIKPCIKVNLITIFQSKTYHGTMKRQPNNLNPQFLLQDKVK